MMGGGKIGRHQDPGAPTDPENWDTDPDDPNVWTPEALVDKTPQDKAPAPTAEKVATKEPTPADRPEPILWNGPGDPLY